MPRTTDEERCTCSSYLCTSNIADDLLLSLPPSQLTTVGYVEPLHCMCYARDVKLPRLQTWTFMPSSTSYRYQKQSASRQAHAYTYLSIHLQWQGGFCAPDILGLYRWMSFSCLMLRISKHQNECYLYGLTDIIVFRSHTNAMQIIKHDLGERVDLPWSRLFTHQPGARESHRIKRIRMKFHILLQGVALLMVPN